MISEPDPLEILSQPMDRIVTEGEEVSFSVMASGDGILVYQWFIDSEAIAEATTDSYVLHEASLADDGRLYHVDTTWSPEVTHGFAVGRSAPVQSLTASPSGDIGVWGIAAAEDAIWIAGNLRSASLNERTVEGLVRFPALD